MNRRKFLSATASGFAASGVVPLAAEAPRRDHPVPVKTPRATSGDPVEPDGTSGSPSRSVRPRPTWWASTEKVIQAAVDSIARWGGGTVRILPGTYRFRNAVYLQSKVRILGSGLDSMIVKEPSLTAKLSQDSDWFDQEITFADASGLPGRRRHLPAGEEPIQRRPRGDQAHAGGAQRQSLQARSGLRKNVWLMGEPKVETLFPSVQRREHHRRGHREHRARRQQERTTPISTATTPAASGCRTATGSRSAT